MRRIAQRKGGPRKRGPPIHFSSSSRLDDPTY
jgi:hypothetical protein